jgi:hypothetical protein
VSTKVLSRFEILKRIVKSRFGSILNFLTFFDHFSARRIECVLDFKLLPFEKKHRNVVIYGTYSKNGLLRSDEIDLIRELSKNNYLVVVQNGSKVDPALPLTKCSYILRENIGRDFGMLRDALKIVNISGSTRNLVWLNSSCTWNPTAIQSLINSEKFLLSPGLMSMTDSWRGGHHLQSYFYFIHFSYLKYFLDFFNFSNVRNWKFKRTVVVYGEKKLSVYFKRLGMNVGCYYPVENFSPLQFKFVTTYLDFKTQLENIGAPFSKL